MRTKSSLLLPTTSAAEQLVDPPPAVMELSSPVHAVLQPGLFLLLYYSKARSVQSPFPTINEKTSGLAAVGTLIILVAGIGALWSPNFIRKPLVDKAL